MSERRFRRTPGRGVLAAAACGVVPEVPARGFWVGGSPAGCGELLEQIAAEHGGQIVAKEVMPDHVHLCRAGRANDAAAQIGAGGHRPHARVLTIFATTRTVLWSPSCFAASVGYVSGSRRCAAISSIQWDAVMAS